MDDLVRRPDAILRPQDAELASVRLPRQVARSVNAELGRGMARAARVSATAYVAQTALANLELLARDEAALARRDPVSAVRAQEIVEEFVFVARREVRNMGGL